MVRIEYSVYYVQLPSPAKNRADRKFLRAVDPQRFMRRQAAIFERALLSAAGGAAIHSLGTYLTRFLSPRPRPVT